VIRYLRAPKVNRKEAAMSDPRNIILIISDTFRYDNLFDRAAVPVRTPQLDAFSKRAVSCSNAIIGSFPTIPHRTDVTTGRYGWPWHGWQDRRGSSANHAPEILAGAGYVSQLICDCPHLFPNAFNVGFDGALVTRGQEGDKPFIRMNYPIEHVMPPEKTRYGRHFRGSNLPDLAAWTNRHWYREIDRFPPRTAELAVEWLEESYRFRPFFLWVDFFDPHEPWDPPEYMVRKYDPDYRGTPMVHPNYGRAGDLTAAELANLRAHYCAEAELVDRWVGRVLQKIDDLGLWENSVVLFTSDHGMSLGEHDRTGKSNINLGDDRFWPLYPEIARAPLMAAAPGLAGGQTIDALVQPPDILPTLMDLAGAAPETPSAPPEPFHGRSFAPLLRGEPQDPLRDFAVSGTFLRRAESGLQTKACTPVLYSLAGDEPVAYVPIGANGNPELYYLADDPLAERNVAEDHADAAANWHGRLLDWMVELEAPVEAMAVFR